MGECIESGRSTFMSWSSKSSWSSSGERLDDLCHGACFSREKDPGGLPTGFLTLWENESLCDVELYTRDGTYIPAHKVVLAAHSPFFKAMFAGASSDMIENAKSSVSVENVDEGTLTTLLKIIYGNISFTARDEDNEAVCCHLEQAIFQDQNGYDVSKLLHAATYLMTQHVVDVCLGYLKHRICVDNVVDILLMAMNHEHADLYEFATEFLVTHVGALLRSWEGASSIHLLPIGTLVDVLNIIAEKRDGIFVGMDIAEFLLLWARCGVAGDDDAHDVIRGWCHSQKKTFYHDEYMMAFEAIKSLERKHGGKLIQSDDALEFVRQSCSPERHQMETPGAGSLCRQTVSAPESHTTSHSTIFVVGGICDGWKPMRSTEMYSTMTDTWTVGPDLPMDCSFTHASTCSDGNTYIPTAKGNTMIQYSPRDMSWHVLDLHGEMTTRSSSACVAHDSSIHIIGGSPRVGRDRHPSSLHECFNHHTNTWETLSPMNVPRASFDACVVFNRIWCAGGQSLRQTHNTMEWYEPALDTWYLSRSTLSTPRKYAMVNAFSEPSSQLVIVGGMDDRRTRLQSVEAFDPREGQLRMMASLPRPISSATSCVCSYDLYVIGGRSDRGTETNRMYALDSRMPNSWRECSPMPTPRSSLVSFTTTHA